MNFRLHQQTVCQRNSLWTFSIFLILDLSLLHLHVIPLYPKHRDFSCMWLKERRSSTTSSASSYNPPSSLVFPDIHWMSFLFLHCSILLKYFPTPFRPSFIRLHTSFATITTISLLQRFSRNSVYSLLCLCRLCATVAIMFLLCPVVCLIVPMSHANMDSSAGRASPLHALCGGGIIWPRAVLSSKTKRGRNFDAQ